MEEVLRSTFQKCIVKAVMLNRATQSNQRRLEAALDKEIPMLIFWDTLYMFGITCKMEEVLRATLQNNVL